MWITVLQVTGEANSIHSTSTVYEYRVCEQNAQSDDVAAEQLVQSPLFQRLRIGVGAETPADIFQPVENIQAIGNLSAKWENKIRCVSYRLLILKIFCLLPN